MPDPTPSPEEATLDALPDELPETLESALSAPTNPTVPFEAMMDQLSTQLEFEDKEKLSLFVRSVVQIVLETFLKPPAQTNPEEAKYRLVNTSRFEVTLELDILTPNGNGLREFCSLGLKENTYLGIPDGTPKLIDLKNLPPLVKRQRVLIKDIKPSQSATWLARNYLKRKAKQCENKDLMIDIQLKNNIPNPLCPDKTNDAHGETTGSTTEKTDPFPTNP